MRIVTQTYFFTAVLLLLFSCKTILVPESSTFTETKYNYSVFSKSIQASQMGEMQKSIFLSSANKIINTNETNILNTGAVQLKRTFYTVDDTVSLEYFIFEPKAVKKTGIYFQGNGTNILHFADKLFELSATTGAKIYVLNYRGYGKSGGHPSFRTQFSDNTAFIKHIEQLEKEPLNFVIGYSLGSVFATYAAVEQDIKTLYLLAPFSNTAHIFKRIEKQYTPGIKALFRPFVRVTADDYLLHISNSEKIKQYKGKLVVFHGTSDQVLPFAMGQHVYNSYASPNKEFVALPAGGHNAPFEKAGWESLIGKVLK